MIKSKEKNIGAEKYEKTTVSNKMRRFKQLIIWLEFVRYF